MKHFLRGTFVILLFGLMVTADQVYSGGGGKSDAEKERDKKVGSSQDSVSWENWGGRGRGHRALKGQPTLEGLRGSLK